MRFRYFGFSVARAASAGPNSSAYWAYAREITKYVSLRCLGTCFNGKGFGMPMGEIIGTPRASRTPTNRNSFTPRTPIYRHTSCFSNLQVHVPARVRIRVDAGPQGHGIGLSFGGVRGERGCVRHAGDGGCEPTKCKP